MDDWRGTHLVLALEAPQHPHIVLDLPPLAVFGLVFEYYRDEDEAQQLYAEARTSMRTGALAPALDALDALTRKLPETPELSEAFA
mgnify:CR=1 FL=1